MKTVLRPLFTKTKFIPFLFFVWCFVPSVAQEQCGSDKYCEDLALERRTSDNFPHMSLTQLLLLDEYQFSELWNAEDNVSTELGSESCPILDELFNGEVYYILPEWEVYDYGDPLLDEFKVCETDDEVFERRANFPLNSRSEYFGYDPFALYFEAEQPNKTAAYRKYQTELNGTELVWLENIPYHNRANQFYPSGFGAIRNVLLEYCVADTTRLVRTELSDIRWGAHDVAPWVGLTKNGLFSYEGHIYSYHYRKNMVFGNASIRVFRQRNFEDRQEYFGREPLDQGESELYCAFGNSNHINIIQQTD